MTSYMPCFCPNLTCFACYVRSVFRAIVLISNPDEQSITDHIMNNHMSAKRPIIKTVLNFLLSNHMLESKVEYAIIGNDADIRGANNSNETPVSLEEHSTDVAAAASTATCSSIIDLDDGSRHIINNRHVVARLNFVCNVCNRPCLSAAGLGSHRRIHRS
ncbi:uncharacterized protein LOC113560887 [Rhopalosiphum maidis]|uniref:uncharacterized protein LOC113560887 n=1 Tax=Rhopalosiphum maidis TaxID=43146 RepID=UPI000EFE1B06|nr:uncharacterized protein LOC113560887 [Rhopalosiphum maidis]